MPWKNQGGGPWGSGPKGPWGSGPQPVGPRPPDLEDLLRRARTYGPVHVALFEKHPQLVQSGNTPFGKLTTDDYVRMELEVRDKRAAVESALLGLRALDQLDLFELIRKKLLNDEQLRGLLGQVAQLVPIVYWTTLFESFLEAGAEHAHSTGGKQT